MLEADTVSNLLINTKTRTAAAMDKHHRSTALRPHRNRLPQHQRSRRTTTVHCRKDGLSSGTTTTLATSTSTPKLRLHVPSGYTQMRRTRAAAQEAMLPHPVLPPIVALGVSSHHRSSTISNRPTALNRNTAHILSKVGTLHTPNSLCTLNSL